MNKKFYEMMEKDIKQFEKKYPGKMFTPKMERELKKIKKEWVDNQMN